MHEGQAITNVNSVAECFHCNICSTGKPFQTNTIMNAAVANIIASILFGKRYEYEDPTFIKLLKLVNENVHLVGSPSVMVKHFKIWF